jgi:starch synthase
MKNIKVLYASSEAAPFAKTGGLADVASSLPKALSKLGADVRLVLPKYKCIPMEYTVAMQYVGYIYVDLGWRHQFCGIFKLDLEDHVVYFIDNEYYFMRDCLYGYPDEAERFTFFCKALLQILPVIGFKPDVIHCNDWQTGIVSLLLNSGFMGDYFSYGVKTIFTIHNLRYQGVFPKQVLHELIGLSWDYFHKDGAEFYDQVSFMKAGLVYSDIITTVSCTYAEEIKQEFFGERLNELLTKRSDSLYGILNGIDPAENDPSNDKRLFAAYDPENLDGKVTGKTGLQNLLGLEQNADIPLIGIISRLVDQKGFDLIAQIIDDLLSEDLQLVVLGTGERRYEEMFQALAAAHPGKVSANMRYDDILAPRIYAGSDMFLMPSLFEPCGLGQLFSLRYGSVPIVRETGGLNDTIKAWNEFTGEGNGFTFADYNAQDMLYTIRRALGFYRQKEIWMNIVRNCMKQDFSWNKSAVEYMELYSRLTYPVS